MAIKYATNLPVEIPASLPVYRLDRPQSAMSRVAELSQRFGLSGKMRDFSLSEDWTAYKEGRFRLSIHKNSGALRFINEDKYGMELEKEFQLSPEESEKISTGFLARTKMYPEKNLRLHKITYLRSGTSDVEGKERTEKVLDAGVVYRRFVDETPVDGPGGFAMVNIDPEGEVVGLRSVWRPTLKREAKVKIMPATQALEMFEKSVSHLQGELTVMSANFGYFEQGELDRQLYLEPAYVFIYAVQNGEVAHKSIEVISAGHRAFARLQGKKRFDGGEQKQREPSNGNQENKPGKSGKRG